MKTLLQVLLITCSSSFLSAQNSRPIGTNLAGVVDYSSELVFTDAFKQSRQWITANSDGSGPWDTGIDIPLNARGFPVSIPYSDGVHPPQKVRSLMLWDLDGGRPHGEYRLIVEGSGQVTLGFGATGMFNCPVDTLVEVNGNVSLEIISSDINDPINDIKFIYPDYITTYQNHTFRSDFLDFLEDFQVIRFMDWLRTNDSPVSVWSERSKYDYYTQTLPSGVAWEYVIELANLTGKDIWINIPHLANDDYIEQLANLLNDELDTTVNIYLEYSNEVWNSMFSQSQATTNLGTALGYTGQPWEVSWKYTAKRSADIFHIFEGVFTTPGRLIKTIPSQAANSWLSNQLVTYFNDPAYNPNGVSANAIAIAPYFAGSVANTIVDENLVSTITVEEIVERMGNSLDEALQFMTDNRQVAANNGLELICYEAGQHLVATGDNVNIDELTEKLIQANHHPDLQDVYCRYLDNWYDSVGTLMVHFSSHGGYSKWGSWGIKETMDDVNNPKYLALQQCVFSNGSLLLNKRFPSFVPDVYPNPAESQLFLSDDVHGKEYIIYNPAGQVMKQGTVNGIIDVVRLQPGMYLLSIDGNSRKFIKK